MANISQRILELNNKLCKRHMPQTIILFLKCIVFQRNHIEHELSALIFTLTFKRASKMLNDKSFTILILQKMFKKPVKVGAQNQLSGKDKKAIKNKLVNQFDPETVDKLFATNDKIICNKISGSKMLIYTNDQYPLFVDGTGKEDYFLSVYSCAAYEPLSKSIYLNEGVEGYIFNGANLMWPGVRDLSRLGNFKKDDIISIKNSKNEVIAVGALGCSLDELKGNPDGSGIAAYIVHYKGDKLWDMGSKVYPEVIVKGKEEKIEVKEEPKVQEETQEIQQKVQLKSKKEEKVEEEEQKPKGKGKQKQAKAEQEVEAPPKGKGPTKKQKKVESDEQKPQQPAKGKGKGKKDKKAPEPQPQQPVAKGKGKGKKQESDEEEIQKGKGKAKKGKKVSSQEEPIEEPVKGKGKGKKQTKEVKPEPKKKEESESDDDIDFGNLVHAKQPQRAQAKVEKKVVQFSDDQEDKKGKKKGGKKGGNKKKQSDDEQEEQVEAPKHKNQHHKGKKPVEEHSSEEEVKQVKKGHQKGKNKKHQSDQQQIHEEKPNKKKANKGKKKIEAEQQQNNEEQVKPQKAAREQEDGQQENQEGAKSAINGQLMDEYFKQAFLNVLKLSKIEGQLPIDSGRFFSDYMILARPEGVKLEIKDTTYKKLGKFYEEMAKKKFIQFKPAKEKKGQQGSTITKILWENEQLKNYFPTVKKMGEKDVQEKVEQYSKQKLKLSKTLQIDYVYKLSEELKKIIMKKVINYMPDKSEDEQDNKDNQKEIYFSEKQLKEKIEKYINQIAIKDGKEAKETKETKQVKQGKDKDKKIEKLITLNYKQNEFIYKLLKRQIEQYEQNLEKEEMMAQPDSDEEEKKKGKKDKKKSLFRIERGLLVNKIFKLALPYYNMSDKSTGLNKFKEGMFKGIQLIADKVINKNVTKIIGVESFSPSNVESDELVKQIHGFAHQLQLKFASSAAVQNLPGKNAGKQIVVQGNFVDELEALFTTEYGIKKQHITIQNKLGKKKKN